MADYQKMYHVLFAATEDALTLLEENMGTCGELGGAYEGETPPGGSTAGM